MDTAFILTYLKFIYSAFWILRYLHDNRTNIMSANEAKVMEKSYRIRENKILIIIAYRIKLIEVCEKR
ncbi:MAG: hypothetical protein WC691_07100 [Sulfuricurvum sp.]